MEDVYESQLFCDAFLNLRLSQFTLNPVGLADGLTWVAKNKRGKKTKFTSELLQFNEADN